jgi:pSer/pThr/pTyr-binding forkhead associated (FHA) protein
MAKLVVLSEGMTGLTYELKAEKTTIGRVEDNAFQIAESSVSSHHCEVLLKGTDVVVRDLDSTNGSFIEGHQFTGESTLKPGQILRLGQVQLRLESGQPASSSKKSLDHTMVLPQGVKMNELETGTGKQVKFESSSPFGKKNNKTALIFIAISVVLGIVIIIFLIKANQQVGTGQ